MKSFKTYTKKQYLGQCDVLRSASDENEERWKIMMSSKMSISFEDFVRGVDMSVILDSDETPMDYINDKLASDPETTTYKSNWGEKEVFFLQTMGFEFIFS